MRHTLTACLLALSPLCAPLAAGCGADRASGPLTHEVYLWQRAWTPGVRAAVDAHAGAFQRVIVLGLEYWIDDDGRPRLATPEIDFEALSARARDVVIAVRIGRLPDERAARAAHTANIAAEIADLLALARAHGVTPAEIQIDHDAATAKLDAYARWLPELAPGVGDTRLTITALPAWLDAAPALARLLKRVDGWVLQVHSVEPPDGPDAIPPLCDTAKARAWVERAADLGVPFRVALPTYGYRAGFASDGRLLGLTAEAPTAGFPPDAAEREIYADAPAIAGLVREWTADRPAEVLGLAWYRLPVPGDRLSWRWRTLEAVMAGAEVAPAVRARLVARDDGLVDVHVENAGLADGRAPDRVDVRWSGPSPIVFADALDGFVARDGARSLRFERAAEADRRERLPAGASRPIGWVRLTPDTPLESIHAQLSP